MLRPHLMLVSCEPELYLRIPPLLRKQGHEVSPVLALNEAVQLVEKQGWPDVLITDGEYDLFGALELCATARQEASLVTMLLIQREQEPHVRKVARPSSVDLFVFKPVRSYAFLPYVERALRHLQEQKRTSQPDTLQRLSFDSTKGLLEIHGRGIQLTPTESRMLYFLLNNTHRVVSQRELFNALWPKAHTTAENLRTIVSRTRRKLRGSGIEIHNARNQGYYVELKAAVNASG